MKPIHIGLAIIAAIVLLVGSAFVGTYNGLIAEEQAVHSKESKYGAALDLCSQKIEGVWIIFDRYLNHESQVFIETARARSAFYEAKNNSDPQGAINAASAFSLNVKAVTEANPQIVSQMTSEYSLNAVQESVNEIKTALDDWIYEIQRYNTMRQSFPTNIVGSLFGFPSEYDYYHPEKTKLEVRDIMRPTS